MNYTNIHNLPIPLVKALLFDDYEHKGDIGITGLISPPRIRLLTVRHNDEITIDVSQNFWVMLGKALHLLLEKFAEKENVLEEQRMYMEIEGWKIAAKPDLWESPDTLADYKFTSVWTAIYGLKREWECQLNGYKPFYERETFPVNNLLIYILGRDWSRKRAKQSKDYPQHEIIKMKVPVWDNAFIMQYLTTRVSLHQVAENELDDELPYCTPEERWEQPTTWAVMKANRVKALRLLPNEKEALKWRDTNVKEKDRGRVYIQKRPGESIRCEEYCYVQKFCSQYKEMKNGTSS